MPSKFNKASKEYGMKYPFKFILINVQSTCKTFNDIVKDPMTFGNILHV